MAAGDITRVRTLLLAGVCLALNVGLGKVSNLLSLPFTMDTIGTILAAALLPWWMTLVVAVLSSVVGSVFIHPAFVFYAGTQVAIALAAMLFVGWKMFKHWLTAGLAGLAIGVISALVSAPVTAIVFGGISVPSISALNAVFLASGRSLWTSVVGGALIVESIDKVAAGIVVCVLLRRVGGIDKPANALS